MVEQQLGVKEESWANSANPPEMVMKLMLLQKKEGFIQAFMAVKKHSAKGASVDYTRTVSWLSALWLECGAVLHREKPDLYKEIAGTLESILVNDHVDAFQKLMFWLDTKGVKWDVRGGYDKTNLKKVLQFQDDKMS